MTQEEGTKPLSDSAQFLFLQKCELVEAEISRIQSSTGTLIQLYGFFVAVLAVIATMTLQGETTQLSRLDASGKVDFVAKLSFFYLLPMMLFIFFAVRCLRTGPLLAGLNFEDLCVEKIRFRDKILTDFNAASVFMVISFVLSSFSTIHIFVTGNFPR